MDLKELRKSKNITQIELAKKVKCDRTLISKIENGKSIPSITIAKSIGAELGVNWTEFYE